jgi:hypothetical protein
MSARRRRLIHTHLCNSTIQYGPMCLRGNGPFGAQAGIAQHSMMRDTGTLRHFAPHDGLSERIR